MTPKCCESYEKKRLEYLLGLREGEIAILRRELSAEREVNKLCAAHLFLALSRLGERDSGKVRFSKAEITEALGKFRAACRDCGDYLEVELAARQPENMKNE